MRFMMVKIWQHPLAAPFWLVLFRSLQHWGLYHQKPSKVHFTHIDIHDSYMTIACINNMCNYSTICIHWYPLLSMSVSLIFFCASKDRRCRALRPSRGRSQTGRWAQTLAPTQTWDLWATCDTLKGYRFMEEIRGYDGMHLSQPTGLWWLVIQIALNSMPRTVKVSLDHYLNVFKRNIEKSETTGQLDDHHRNMVSDYQTKG